MNNSCFGVIGYKRHAAKHVELLLNNSNVNKVVTYHPTIALPGVTNDIRDILNCDGIIIASPTHTHLSYVKLLNYNNFVGGIFLEKPGFASLEESRLLRNIVNSDSPLNIMIGYNYPYCSSIVAIIDILTSYDVGQIIKVAITSCKGISYNKNFKDDWRSKDVHAVSHTLLGHHLSIFSAITNEVYDFSHGDFVVRLYQNIDNSFYDTVTCQKSISYPLFDSLNTWGAPLVDLEISILCANAIVKLIDDDLLFCYPRDTFDDAGLFAPPPLKQRLSFIDDGINKISEYFVDAVLGNMKFSKSRLIKDISIGELAFRSNLVSL